jgi:hypothetical protein
MPRNTDSEKALFFENLTASRARNLAFVNSDIDSDGAELSEETGMTDPFDPVRPGVQASIGPEAAQSMAAISRDNEGDGLETSEEVGLSDPFGGAEPTDPALRNLTTEQARGLEFLASDLDGDGADLTEETGLTDPFNDDIGGSRGGQQTNRDLDDMGMR